MWCKRNRADGNMTSTYTDQLPHLLSLLDDPSYVVKEEVRSALSQYGYFLRPASRDWVATQSDELKQEWDFTCRMAESLALEQTWLSWMLLQVPAQQIEAGMMSLELGGSYSGSFIQDSLQDLVDEYKASYEEENSIENLIEFLYTRKGFDKTLRNQNYLQHRLGYILRYRKGSQLGLGILTMVMGARIGLTLSLVKMQGNWLLLDQSSEKNILYNPEHQCARLLRSEEMCMEEAYRRDLLLADGLSATTEEIMEEIIQSHIEGYKRSGLYNRESEMEEKLQVLKHEIERRELVSFLIE